MRIIDNVKPKIMYARDVVVGQVVKGDTGIYVMRVEAGSQVYMTLNGPPVECVPFVRLCTGKIIPYRLLDTVTPVEAEVTVK